MGGIPPPLATDGYQQEKQLALAGRFLIMIYITTVLKNRTIRLPGPVVQMHDLQEGDVIEVTWTDIVKTNIPKGGKHNARSRAKTSR